MALWGKIDQEADKPKYLNAADKAATVGVDVAEATTAANIAKGINKPGWVKYTTYTDAQGSTRHKAETLVAFSSMTGDNDTIDPDPVITIGTQPVAASVTSPADVVFTVAASTNKDPVTLSYQWQVSTDSGSTWADTVDADGTGATLTVISTDAEYVDANEFRVIVSATGAADVTSDEVAATIA
jgi:hypothetical protein